MGGHVALLGDSVFDNAAYTGGQPDVAAHLRAALPADWSVTLLAVDGTTTHDIGPQLDRIPRSATHLVLSLGGNNALLNADLLGTLVTSTAEALLLFRERLRAFAQSYGWVLEALREADRPLLVCTIYNGNLDDEQAPLAETALRMFNDVIFQSARAGGADLLELRAVCTGPADFANPIEPSGPGGQKIARAIAAALGSGLAASAVRLLGPA